MKQDDSENTYSLLPAGVSWDLQPWFTQCESMAIPDPTYWPVPLNLGALCEYTTAMVLTDGIVVTTGSEYLKYVVPDWIYGGMTNAYGPAGPIENILYNLQKKSDTQIILNDYRDDYNEFTQLFKLYNRDSLINHEIVTSYDIAMQNYLAWEIYPRKLAEQQIVDFLPILDTEYVFCRSLLENSRPTIKDVLERPYATITAELGEVQLPLILAVAVSRIDSPQQLSEELSILHKEFDPVRKKIRDIENILNNSTDRGSGKHIRLLKKDLESAVKKAGNFSSMSQPSDIEKTLGILSLDPLTAVANIFKDGIFSAACDYFKQPELRLLSAWTKDCAYDTVRKLRRVFKTNGTDAEWKQVAKLLQKRGTIAWYPSRKSTL